MVRKDEGYLNVTTGIIFMTALVPTIGHKRAIEFAAHDLSFQGDAINVLHVVLSSRSFEPMIRAIPADFQSIRSNLTTIKIHKHLDDNAPQNCVTDEEWQYWVDIAHAVAGEKIDTLFASDNYAIEFAKRIGCKYIPVDPYREVLPVKGSAVRSNLFDNQDLIMKDWFRNHQSTFVLFGQESVGKTTMAKMLSQHYNTPFYHEWARPYLETVGSELTEEKMINIVRGQTFIDNEIPDALVKIQDTNIASTYGYCKLWGSKEDRSYQWSKLLAANLDVTYLILDPEDVPFEKDQLRFGGDKRETNMEFWIDVLNDLNAKYHIISKKTIEERFDYIRDIIDCESGAKELMEFVRD